MPLPCELSTAALAGMVCFARGDRRIYNALCLRIMHGQGFREIGRAVGVADTTVREWCRGYASAAKDYCELAGISEIEFAGGTKKQQQQRQAEPACAGGGGG